MHGTIVPSEAMRVVRRSNDWTLKEHEAVVSHWPDVATIKRCLPHRTVTAIRNFAGKCNLRRETHIWTGAEDAVLRKRVREGASRQTIADELKMTLNQVANRMAYSGVRYERRGPRLTGNRLMDAVFARAHELNLNRRDLDEICRSGGQFRRWNPTRKMSIRHVLTAVKYMQGELSVEWRDS